MRYLAHALFALYSIATTTATPVLDIAKRNSGTGLDGNIGGIYMCKEKFFRGECAYFQSQVGQCWNFNDNWRNSISSFGPDRPSDAFYFFNCTIFAESSCLGVSETLRWPGAGELNAAGPIMDKKAESWKCNFLNPDAQEAYSAAQH